MGAGSKSQRGKAAYDPQRKWGLSPAEGGNVAPSPDVDGATYIVAGHVVAGGKRDLFVNENVGREAQARAARKANSRDTDAALKRLLARDKEGMKAVQEARKFAKNVLGKQNAEGKALKKDGSSRKARKKREGDDVSDGDSESGIDGECASESDGGVSGDKPTKNAYSARVIKELGFDPTALRSGRGKDDHSRNVYSKVRVFHIPSNQPPS
jgi:minichromosome maintenance protein 10